jgi:hypothetical protein
MILEQDPSCGGGEIVRRGFFVRKAALGEAGEMALASTDIKVL